MPCFLYKYIDYIRVIQPKSPEIEGRWRGGQAKQQTNIMKWVFIRQFIKHNKHTHTNNIQQKEEKTQIYIDIYIYRNININILNNDNILLLIIH